jgi:hypothetical protein
MQTWERRFWAWDKAAGCFPKKGFISMKLCAVNDPAAWDPLRKKEVLMLVRVKLAQEHYLDALETLDRFETCNSGYTLASASQILSGSSTNYANLKAQAKLTLSI